MTPTSYHEDWKRAFVANDDDAIRNLCRKRLDELAVINFEIKTFAKYCMRLCGKHILHKYAKGTLEYAAYIGKDEDLWKYDRWPNSGYGEKRNDDDFNVKKAIEKIRALEDKREWFAGASLAMSLLDGISNEPIEALDSKQMYKNWYDSFIPLYMDIGYAHPNPEKIKHSNNKDKIEDLKTAVEHRWHKTHDSITELRKQITGLCCIPDQIKAKREERLAESYSQQVEPIRELIESSIADYNQANGLKRTITANTIRRYCRKLAKINSKWSKSTFLTPYNPNLPDELK